ncbi:MAG: CDP-diacylglycerol--glycerol-3-phosphate 3-phosphatidyltransferase [Thermotogae bacterium]|nr:CDP-diacylglycerol--glycerol-3-phosphate 3-phosphatidyltransferase [Thermotogota bacterium]
MNLANTLSLSRIFLTVPIFILTYMGENYYPFALIIFIIASLTDMFDGMAARKLNQVTDIGKFLDQICDKIMINTVFIILLSVNLIPGWFVAVIVARDTFVNGIRLILANRNVVVAADKLGKLKTVLQIVLISLIYFYYSLFNGGNVNTVLESLNIFINILVYITAFISVFSGINYFVKNSKSIK